MGLNSPDLPSTVVTTNGTPTFSHIQTRIGTAITSEIQGVLNGAGYEYDDDDGDQTFARDAGMIEDTLLGRVKEAPVPLDFESFDQLDENTQAEVMSFFLQNLPREI